MGGDEERRGGREGTEARMGGEGEKKVREIRSATGLRYSA